MNELLPCPFCGSEAETNPMYGEDEASCSNPGCIAWLNPRGREEWNRRVYPAEIRAVLKAAKAFCNRIDMKLFRDNGYGLEAAVRAYQTWQSQHDGQVDNSKER